MITILVSLKKWMHENQSKILLSFLLLITLWGYWIIFGAGYIYAKSTYGDYYYIIYRYSEYLFLGIMIFLLTQMIPDRISRINPIFTMLVALSLCIWLAIFGPHVQGVLRYAHIFSFSVRIPDCAMFLFMISYSVLLYRNLTIINRSQLISFGLLSVFLFILFVLEPNYILIFYTITNILLVSNLILPGNKYVKLITVITFAFVGFILLFVTLYGLSVYTGNHTLENFIQSLPGMNLGMKRYMSSVLLTDPYQNSYQQLQAIIAFVKGGITGVGPGNSMQATILPDQFRSFLIALIGEEYGLLGLCILAAGYLLYTYLGLKATQQASDQQEAIVCLSLTLMITVRALIAFMTSVGLLFPNGTWLPFLNRVLPDLIIDWYSAGYIYRILRRKKPESDFFKLPVRRIMSVLVIILCVVLIKILYHDIQGSIFQRYDIYIH